MSTTLRNEAPCSQPSGLAATHAATLAARESVAARQARPQRTGGGSVDLF